MDAATPSVCGRIENLHPYPLPPVDSEEAAVEWAKNKWLDGYLDKIDAGPNRSVKTFWDAASMLKRGIGNTKPAVVIKMKKADGTLCTSEAENAEVFQAHLERLYNNVTPYDQGMIDRQNRATGC